MAIGYEQVKAAAAALYDRALRRVPDDTLAALRSARERETNPVAASTLQLQLRSAEVAAERDRFVCSDAGVPAYLVKIGADVALGGGIRRAFRDGFAELVERIDPPLLKHVTNR